MTGNGNGTGPRGNGDGRETVLDGMIRTLDQGGGDPEAATEELGAFWRTLGPSAKAFVIFGPSRSASDAIMNEAGHALELHEVLVGYGPIGPADALERAAAELGLSSEFYAYARKLLRLYPTAREAHEAMRAIFDRAMNELQLRKAQRDLEAARKHRDPDAVRRIAREIENLRGLPRL